MRLGLFGGSFDPVHHGHLALARACRDQAELDKVWLAPTATQPFKQHGPAASDEDRLAMLRLAVDSEQGLVVASIEIDRGGVSYTVDTLREVAKQHPAAELFLLMGADTLADLPDWREPEEVLRLARPLVVHRPGDAIPTDYTGEIVEMPRMDVSSSDLRRRVAAEKAIDMLAPAAVVDYIQQHGLYR